MGCNAACILQGIARCRRLYRLSSHAARPGGRGWARALSSSQTPGRSSAAARPAMRRSCPPRCSTARRAAAAAASAASAAAGGAAAPGLPAGVQPRAARSASAASSRAPSSALQGMATLTPPCP